MPSGYDKRIRLTGRMPFESRADDGTLNAMGHTYSKSQEVISYRDNIEGTRVDPRTFEPYTGYLTREGTLGSYLRPSASTLMILESAGLAESPDYESDGFTDTGHPFEVVTRKVGTSLHRPRRVRRSNFLPAKYGTGFPFWGQASIDSGIEPLFGREGWTTSLSRRRAGFPELPSSGDTQRILSDGRRAIATVAPGRPEVSVTAMVLELMTGIPAVPGKAILQMKNLQAGGDEWLNLLFGLIPTHDDAIEFGQVLLDITRKLRAYRAQAGKMQRRRISFPASQRSEIYTNSQTNNGEIRFGPGLGFGQHMYYGHLYSSADTAGEYDGRSSEIFQMEEREFTFSGAFTYYIPEMPGFSGRLGKYIQELDRMIGLSMDASTVWQITPWSWLVDWFFDIRQNIDLISLAHDDSLVMNYGYAMESLTRRTVCKVTFRTPSPGTGVKFAVTSYEASRKRRVRASPYGFLSSSDSEDWSPYRWSVLAALGISRSS